MRAVAVFGSQAPTIVSTVQTHLSIDMSRASGEKRNPKKLQWRILRKGLSGSGVQWPGAHPPGVSLSHARLLDPRIPGSPDPYGPNCGSRLGTLRVSLGSKWNNESGPRVLVHWGLVGKAPKLVIELMSFLKCKTQTPQNGTYGPTVRSLLWVFLLLPFSSYCPLLRFFLASVALVPATMLRRSFM